MANSDGEQIKALLAESGADSSVHSVPSGADCESFLLQSRRVW